MYAISEVDAKKSKKLEKSVQFAFHFAGTGGNDRPPSFDGPASTQIVAPLVMGPQIIPVSREEIERAEQGALDRMRGDIVARLEQVLPFKELQDVVQLTF